MAINTDKFPDTWGWDDHDLLLTGEDARAAERDRIIARQLDSFDQEEVEQVAQVPAGAPSYDYGAFDL